MHMAPAADLTDSPAAMAGWIVDKIREWTDHTGNFEDAYPRERILTTLSLYWFTRTLGSSARFYSDSARQPWTPIHHRSPVVDVPTAVLADPEEPAATPRRLAQSHLGPQRYTTESNGGHFAPVEDPDGLAGDLNTFLHGDTTTTYKSEIPEPPRRAQSAPTTAPDRGDLPSATWQRCPLTTPRSRTGSGREPCGIAQRREWPSEVLSRTIRR